MRIRDPQKAVDISTKKTAKSELQHHASSQNYKSARRNHTLSMWVWCTVLLLNASCTPPEAYRRVSPQSRGVLATATSGLRPVGAVPSPGKQFQLTFDDEFNNDTIETSLWNGDYANLQWCKKGRCPQDFKGITLNNGILSLQATVNYENFEDGSGRADVNSGGLTASSAKFNQRYGYFEWRAKLPHDRTGEGDGLWPALWALPIGKSSFPGSCAPSNEEVDVLETVLSTTNTRQVHFSVHDYCFNQYSLTYPTTPVGDLSAAYHIYGLYWRDDASPHGSMQVYFDGIPQGPPYVLDARSSLWDNGIYLLNQIIPCGKVPNFGGSPCTSKTSSNDPFLVDYARAYSEAPGSP